MNLTVAKCTESSKGGFIVKLVGANTTKVMFGTTTADNSSTYYIKLAGAVTVGASEDVDVDEFDVVVRPYTFINEEGEEVTAMLKWLHVKKG